MAPGSESLSEALGTGKEVDHFDVTVSADIVHLLSEQLYTSATKAIEELVVNAYDADATECRIALVLEGVGDTPLELAAAGLRLQTGETGLSLPYGSAKIKTDADNAAGGLSDDDQADRPGAEVAEEPDQDGAVEKDETFPPPTADALIAVFDDGESMDEAGLRNLWSVGASPKRNLAAPTGQFGRKVIGKFGIGKIATYAIANRITYVVCSEGKLRHVSCDFRSFKSNGGPVTLHVREIVDLAPLLQRRDMDLVLNRLDIKAASLTDGSRSSWTLCLLDDLKPKATRIRSGSMRYVLRTAMPLSGNFRVFLDGKEQQSSKTNFAVVEEMAAADIEDKRLAKTNDVFKTDLRVENGMIVDNQLFPNGIWGRATITEKPLEGGKSDALGRSNGFFIKVRGRVVNLDNALFYNTERSHKSFSRFWCELNIDDLHEELMASREAVEESRRRDVAAYVAREIFEQIRNRFENRPPPNQQGHYTPEDRRTKVEEGLVERPLADVLLTSDGRATGGDPDGGWFYIEPVPAKDKAALVDTLYTKRTPYTFKRSSTGRGKPLTRFDPVRSEFDINENHQLVLAFDDPQHQELLDIIATAEVMLEIYLAEAGVAPHAIAEILQKRDKLLRDLASERIYSPTAIAEMLRESDASDIDLELGIVAAARVLGFQAKHIGQKGEPDGIAVLVGSSMDEVKITLEAKASGGVPSLGQVDYQTLERHRDAKGATGVMLVAPRYPGQADDGSAIATNARGAKVSSWTVSLLAELVQKANRYRITASQVLDIVTTKFAPADVEAAVRELLSNERDLRPLYSGIMAVLTRMFRGRQSEGDVRELAGIKAVLNDTTHPKATSAEVRRALGDLATASSGAMELRENDTILFLSSIEEVKRRVAGLTGEAGPPRSIGTFRSDTNQPELPD